LAADSGIIRAALLACLLLCWGALAASPENGEPGAKERLFDSDALLDITIALHFKDLCRPREDENCDFIPTTLEYTAAGGGKQELPVEVMVRGGWRSLSQNCSAPLLWVRFDADSARGTLFEGQSLLPLTTHCGQGLSLESMRNRRTRSDSEQDLLKEYLGQHMYTLFTGYSLRTRLLRINYVDPDKPGRVVHNYAFFTEHFDSMAERNHARRLERGQFDYRMLDLEAADRLALFQYMIGNTDWSIVRQRNTLLVLTAEGRQVPVPYDLDMSGLVNADYAGPAPGLPIDSVTQRHYLGFCHPGQDWQGLFDEFLARKMQIRESIGDIPGLSERSSLETQAFLIGFFKTIEDESLRQQKIIEACQPWPPSSTDHTTPTGTR
jgi:hypothetical protein